MNPANNRIPGRISRAGLWFQVRGAGPWVILLHGFPSSGEDWDEIAPMLATQARVLVPDMLGYGRSAKPQTADYAAHAHVERLLALCDELGIRSAVFVGHDLGGIVLQQVLHRWSTGQCRVDVLGAAFLNSSLYPHLYHPTLLQRLLAIRPIGRLLAPRMSGKSFTRALRQTWGPSPPDDAVLRRMWQLFSADDGLSLVPEHLQYIAERRRDGPAWMREIERIARPLALIWGVDDPVSGNDVLAYARGRLPRASVTELRAGHFPQVEQPAAVVQALVAWLPTALSHITSAPPASRAG